jgi:branched-chain amino acid transport system permease protein
VSRDATPAATAPARAPALPLAWLKRHRAWLAAAVLLLVLPHLPGLDGGYGRSLLTQMGITAVFALSYNLLLGHTGLLSFGHAVYFGLGAYGTIHFIRWVNDGLAVPIMLAPLAGAAAGLVFGILFGSVTTRKAGTIFALITLGIVELVHSSAFLLHGFFGGEEGVSADRTWGPELLGITLGPQIEVYYLVAAWALVAAALMYGFLRTPLGRLCNAVRDNPERAEFIGYNPQRVRFIAFCVSATFAGLAGGLFAINYEIVSAEAVGPLRSASVLIATVIGGIHHFLGPVIGAVVLVWLQVNLSSFTSAWLLYFGLFFMAIVVFAPGGLAGLVMMHAPIARTRAFLSVLAAYAAAALPAAVMLIGASLLIEMNYILSTKPEVGRVFPLYGIEMNTATPWPWLAAAVLLVGGFFGFRRTWPWVARAWERAAAEAATGGRAP